MISPLLWDVPRWPVEPCHGGSDFIPSASVSGTVSPETSTTVFGPITQRRTRATRELNSKVSHRPALKTNPDRSHRRTPDSWRDVERDRARDVAGTRRDFQLGFELHWSCCHDKHRASGTRRNRYIRWHSCNGVAASKINDESTHCRGRRQKHCSARTLTGFQRRRVHHQRLKGRRPRNRCDDVQRLPRVSVHRLPQ